MGRNRLAAATAAALIAGASTAQAAPYEFAGFYAGGHAGYADIGAGFSGGDLDGGGVIGGLQAGYNIIDGNLMYGIETDISGISSDASGTCPFDATLSCSAEVNAVATLRPRIGYGMDNWLFYATGGIAGGNFDIQSRDARGTKFDDVTEGAFGWTLGAGVEYMVGDIVGVKLEYRYMRFGSVDFDPVTVAGSNDVDFDLHTITGGINFHF